MNLKNISNLYNIEFINITMATRINKLYKINLNTTNQNYAAGDIYKQLWKCATGGLGFSKRHRKKKSFKPIEVEHIKFGNEKVKWMGLNKVIESPLVTSKELNYKKMITTEKREPINKINDVETFLSPHNLTRNISGYTNKSMLGRYVGYPVEEDGDDEFRDFESRVILIKKQIIKRPQSKYRLFRVVVLTGNKKGTLGIGEARDEVLLKAVEIARNNSVQNLYSVPIYDDHTIAHETSAQFNNTYIAIDPRPRGYGIIAQRTVVDICNLSGIQNLYAKLEGNTKNALSIVKAFLRAVYSLETHQDLADRTGCIVVAKNIQKTYGTNFGSDNGYFKVMALPSSKSIVMADKKRQMNMDDQFFNDLSHYRGLHEPKNVLKFFEENLKKPKPLRERFALQKIIDAGD